MKPVHFLFLVFLVFLAFLFARADAHAEDGVHADSILFGQTAALTGPAAKLGLAERLGIRTAFAEINAAGGIYGRRLELTTLDDGYEPGRAVENAHKLISEDKVFLLTGIGGTPTVKAVLPIAIAAGVPVVAPFTGAEFLRDRRNKYVINVRGSYFQEAERMAAYLVDKRRLKKIAILYQDDSFGRTGYEGLKTALARRGIKLSGVAIYERNTLAVKRAILHLQASSPEAIVLFGTYKPLAAFIRLYRQQGGDPLFMAVSFAGSEALASELGAEGRDVMVTEVVPYPHDRSIAIVDAYQRAMERFAPPSTASSLSLEGYIVGRFLAELLKAAGPQPTRQGVLTALYAKGVFHLDDLPLRFGPGDNQGLDSIYLSRLPGDGTVRQVLE